MYNEYRYPAFLRGLIVSELPVIIDHAIHRTICKYGSLVNNPRTRHEHLMIFSSYMSFALDEVGNVLVTEAKEDVKNIINRLSPVSSRSNCHTSLTLPSSIPSRNTGASLTVRRRCSSSG